MRFLPSLIPTRFSEVPHGGVIRVLPELDIRSTIPQFESKQSVILDLCKIVNALGAFEDNRLKKNHPLIVPLPSTEPVKFYRQDYHKYLPEFSWKVCHVCFEHKKLYYTLHILNKKIIYMMTLLKMYIFFSSLVFY